MAQEETFFRLLYRRGLFVLVVVTAVTAGGRLLWEWFSPKPEPALSARLNREYLGRFRRLGVVSIKRDGDVWKIDVTRAGKDDVSFPAIECVSSPWLLEPPDFDIERDGPRLNAYANVDKDKYSFAQVHDAIARCLDMGLTQAAHADEANASWGRS